MSRKTFETLSNSLTPNEVKNKEFKRSPFGYSPDQVIEFLDTVSKCWERVQRREKELIDEIRILNEEIDRLNSRETEIEQLRVAALEDAERIREQAREEAKGYFEGVKQRSEDIRGRTEEWLADLLNRVEETERRRNSFLTAFKSALDQHYEILNTDLEKNQGLESQLTHFLAQMNKQQQQRQELPQEPSTIVTENESSNLI